MKRVLVLDEEAERGRRRRRRKKVFFGAGFLGLREVVEADKSGVSS